MSKPIRVFYSQLTGRFYATRQWRDNGDGTITVTGEKFDVTQDIARAVVKLGIEFKPVEPEEGRQ